MYKSMAKMRKMQPEMEALQERFAADPQRQQQEMLKLYQREKVNPLAGCLPMLPQVFVFYALFHTLLGHASRCATRRSSAGSRTCRRRTRPTCSTCSA